MNTTTTIDASGVLVVTDGTREVLRIGLVEMTRNLDADSNANLARVVDATALASEVILRLLGESEWNGYDSDLHRSREEILAGIGKVHAQTVEQISRSREEAWRVAWSAHDIVNNYADLLQKIVVDAPPDKRHSLLYNAKIRIHERAVTEYARAKALAAQNGVNVEEPA